ncbi:MAG: type II toxin-antitoxin system VapC family toxin [Alphaproteobacteria bacterium]|nr:type II toxin-antitoxin system VapC family toxin [Alphaproteobacteria bacterium]
MRLLLDTHALLWFAADDPALNKRAARAIASRGNDVLVSTVSLWEVAAKRRVGKIDIDPARLKRGSEDAGLVLLAVTPEHVERLGRLRWRDDHRDPFDHLLLAIAATERARLVTADARMQGYGVALMQAG